jgi:predicted ATPase
VVGLLRSRLDALDPADRAVFDTVAVAGGAVRHDLISALGPGDAELLRCVKRLRGCGVLEEHLGDPGVRYQVTHPLLAEVAYEELPAVVRCRTHAAIASALARLDPGDVSRLAHHVRGAGDEVDAGTALDVLVAALERALESKAGEEAVGHAEAAIGLVHRLGRGELLPRLQEQRAEALELAGRGDAAIAAWRAAAESSVARGQAVDRGDHFVNRDDPAAVAERLWWVWYALHAATTVNGARRASAAHVFDVIAERRRWAGT